MEDNQSPQQAAGEADPEAPTFSHELLRRIIREEVAAAVQAPSTSESGTSTTGTSTTATVGNVQSSASALTTSGEDPVGLRCPLLYRPPAHGYINYCLRPLRSCIIITAATAAINAAAAIANMYAAAAIANMYAAAAIAAMYDAAAIAMHYVY